MVGPRRFNQSAFPCGGPEQKIAIRADLRTRSVPEGTHSKRAGLARGTVTRPVEKAG